MINYQNLFDDVVQLLEKQSSGNNIVSLCLEACTGELAFTPAKKDKTVAKDTLLEVYKCTDNDTYNLLKPAFSKSDSTNISIWYLDTEKGNFTIYTNKDCTEFIGIKKTDKTLSDIRKEYFLQKEALHKVGEKPLYNYEENEVTFINKKLVQ